MKTLPGAAWLCLLAAAACADPVITFDDISAPSSSVVPLPTAYHGLNWNGLGALDGVNFGVKPSGYQAGVVSSNNVVYPTQGDYNGSFSGSMQGGLFDLRSAYLTAVLYDNLSLEAKGYIHGTVVYDTTNILSATAPTLIQFNFYGVDEVDFITSGGGVHPGYPFGFDPGFAMDNVNVEVYVPYTQLIQNGGFESGDFTDWFQSGDTNQNSVTTNAPYAHSGVYGAKAGPTVSLGYLSQTVMPTFAGETCQVSFWVENPVAGTPNEFLAAWNGVPLVDVTNLPVLPWTYAPYYVTPYTPRSHLQFGLKNVPAYFGLDDVSVTLVPKVQNGGFETGDYTSWTKSGNTNGESIVTWPSFARSGTHGAALGAVGSVGYISQTLNTYPGQAYLISFWLNRPTANPGTNEFLASWNGHVLFTQTNLPAGGWTNLHFIALATDAQSTLTFGARNDPDYFALDEISVMPVPLIANGGFETGDFSGWTQSGNTNSTSVTTNSAYKSSGYYGAKCGPIGSLGFLSQDLNTLAGQTYLVSCWLNNPSGGTPNEFQILWDGVKVLDFTNWFSTTWINPQFFITASSTNSTLQFGFDDTPSYLALDEVTVQPFPAPKIQSVTAASGVLTFAWNSVVGFAYQVQYSTDLKTWNNLGSPTYAPGYTMIASDNIGPDPHRFYRILLEQPIFLF